MSADRDDDERVARLIKRVRPHHDDTADSQDDREQARWRPLKRRGRRTFTTEIASDGAQLLREID